MPSFMQMPTEWFDNLTVAEKRWRLDSLVQPVRDPTTGKIRAGFESLQSCWAEDARRGRALSKLPNERYHEVDGCDAAALAHLLSSGADAKRLQKCSASAAYMRDRRLAFLGSILKLVHDTRLDVALICVGHPAWYFTPRYNWSLLCSIPEEFFDLIEPRIYHRPGFLIAFLSGRYNPNAGNIQLFVRGICAGKKLREFEKLEMYETTPRMFYEDIYGIEDLPRQISAMMPNRIMEWPEPSPSGPRRVSRMREPYHSIYLMWLAQHPLSDMIFTDGIALDEQKGLILETGP